MVFVIIVEVHLVYVTYEHSKVYAVDDREEDMKLKRICLPLERNDILNRLSVKYFCLRSLRKNVHDAHA